jgi:ATP/maltotriose-dependent transcriptional regulator MalT
LALPEYLGMLAEAYGKGGRADEGLRVLAEAQALVHKNAERRFEAELLRIKGELLWQQVVGTGVNPALTASSMEAEANVAATSRSPGFSEMEGCFRQAIDVARHQQARSWQLRAAMSLARLWQSQGKHAEAHQILAESYSWFTEGFETPDLQTAKGLIEALARTEGRVRCDK